MLLILSLYESITTDITNAVDFIYPLMLMFLMVPVFWGNFAKMVPFSVSSRGFHSCVSTMWKGYERWNISDLGAVVDLRSSRAVLVALAGNPPQQTHLQWDPSLHRLHDLVPPHRGAGCPLFLRR